MFTYSYLLYDDVAVLKKNFSITLEYRVAIVKTNYEKINFVIAKKFSCVVLENKLVVVRV